MDQSLPQHNTFSIKKASPFIVTGFILLAGVVFALLRINNNPGRYQFPSITSQQTTTTTPEYLAQEGESLVFSYSPSSNGNAIDLFVEPQQSIDNLITFGLDLEVTGATDSNPSQYKVSLEPAFSQAGWSLLVNDISADEGMRIQLAGVRNEATPYAVDEKLHIATLTIPATIDPLDLEIAVAPKLSEAFDKQMTVYKIISSQESADL